MSFIKDIEKTPLSSKKFIAYFVGSLSMKAVLCFMILHAVSPAIIMWTVTCLMLVETGYILGQSGLDALQRLAHIKSLSQQIPTIEPDKEEP